MLTRLSRALLRVFPALLLVVVGLLAALFRRRGPRRGATMPVPAPAGQPVPAGRQRGPAIALLSLLFGIGLILAVYTGAGTLRWAVPPLSSSDGRGVPPVAALAQTEISPVPKENRDAVVPAGSATTAEPGGRDGARAAGTPDPHAPTFDTVRVEPNGDLVVAGRAPPNSTVELLVDGKATARVVADANGQFAVVPPALPAGNSEVGLRVTDGDGAIRRSRDSVAVAVSPSRAAKPLVALSSPDRPTVVLSQPDFPRTADRPASPAAPGRPTMAGAPAQNGSRELASSAAADGSGGAAPATVPAGPGSAAPDASATPPSGSTVAEGAPEGPTKIVSVDAQEGGRLFVTGQAAPGATMRLYLNDTLIAPARVGRDGTVTFTIGRGVKPGAYKIRLDQVDPASGKVRSRVEVPFSVPEVARTAGTDGSIADLPGTHASRDGDRPAASNASQPVAASPAPAARPGRTTGASDGPTRATPGSPAASGSPDALSLPRDPEADPTVVFVPEVRTARIARGDSLWAISRRAYGEGDRYTAIYDANQDQIRDPDLIYPGQVFVLPSEDAIDAVQDGKRG